MKIKKFLSITLLMIVARGCDFYSTSLWIFEPGGMEQEMNPLVSWFGMGWNALVISNIALVLLILVAYYYHCFHFNPKKRVTDSPSNYREYVSLLYFGVKNQFYQSLYRIPKYGKPYFAHMGYALTRAVILGSFLAAIHNISIHYQLEYYTYVIDSIKRPTFLIYTLFIVSAVLFYLKLVKREYRMWLANH